MQSHTPATASVAEMTRASIEELTDVLSRVDEAQADALVRAITVAPRVFVVGEGRSGMVVRMFAMRLVHLGRTAFVVGETVTPSIARADLLVAVSGSGTTAGVKLVADAAKAAGAVVALLTTAPDSPLAHAADHCVVLPAAAKEDHSGARSKQFSGTLFEQSSLLFLDGVFRLLSVAAGATAQTMYSRHANLE